MDRDETYLVPRFAVPADRRRCPIPQPISPLPVTVSTSLPETALGRVRARSGADARFVHLSLDPTPTGWLARTDRPDLVGPLREAFEALPPDDNAGELSVELLPSAGQTAEQVVCIVGALPVRGEPAERAEQVTEMLLGEQADLLYTDEPSGWHRVRQSLDGYLGWVSPGGVAALPQLDATAWATATTLRLEPASLVDPATREVIRRGPAGSRLPTDTLLTLPDGVTVRVEPGSGPSLSVRDDLPLGERIVEAARGYFGTPYRWGGRSPLGIDCSGLTQMAYRLCGVEIPRDASLQVLQGSDLGTDPAAFQPGDLLFYTRQPDEPSRKITHVSIWTGRASDVIHASSWVRINSADERSPAFSRRLHDTFVGARRLIPAAAQMA